MTPTPFTLRNRKKLRNMYTIIANITIITYTTFDNFKMIHFFTIFLDESSVHLLLLLKPTLIDLTCPQSILIYHQSSIPSL